MNIILSLFGSFKMCPFIFKLKYTHVQCFLGGHRGVTWKGGDDNTSHCLLSAYYVPNTLLQALCVPPGLMCTISLQWRAVRLAEPVSSRVTEAQTSSV
jgi:hypothetical protein